VRAVSVVAVSEESEQDMSTQPTAEKQCKCDLRTKLLGDGCEVCNPALALEYAKERITELETELLKAQQLAIRQAALLRKRS
jgi:hypothetical protein